MPKNTLVPPVDFGTARLASFDRPVLVPGMGGERATPWRFDRRGARPIWLEFWIVRGDAWAAKRAKADRSKGWRHAAPHVVGQWRELVPARAVAQVERALAALRRAPKGGPHRFKSGRLRKPPIVRVIAGALADWGAPVGAEEIARVAEAIAGEHIDRRLITRTLDAEGWIAPWTCHAFARYVRPPREAWAAHVPREELSARRRERVKARAPRRRERRERPLKATVRALVRQAPNAR